jgi:hypothetical protein
MIAQQHPAFAFIAGTAKRKQGRNKDRKTGAGTTTDLRYFVKQVSTARINTSRSYC